jgi:type II secretory pathway pseudopilin PulG
VRLLTAEGNARNGLGQRDAIGAVWPRTALRSRRGTGFTLLEVIVACTIFFLVTFSILQVIAQGLAAARKLQQREPDAGVLAAVLSLTNRLEEGSESGDFEDLFPGLYPDYSWSREIYEASSNGLFQVDFTVYRRGGRQTGPSETRMSILLFRPGSPTGGSLRPSPR